jgi:hypothetical protein
MELPVQPVKVDCRCFFVVATSRPYVTRTAAIGRRKMWAASPWLAGVIVLQILLRLPSFDG